MNRQKNSHRLFLGLIVLLVAGLFAGCVAERSATVEVAQKEEAPAVMSHKKAAAPVLVSYQMQRDLPVGLSFPVVIEVTMGADAKDLELRIEGSEGVWIEDAPFEKIYEAQSKGSVLSETLNVVADYEGINYLRLRLIGDFGSRRMHYPQAIPLYIGNSIDAPAVQKSTNPLIRDDEGPGLILMPAQEPK